MLWLSAGYGKQCAISSTHHRRTITDCHSERSAFCEARNLGLIVIPGREEVNASQIPTGGAIIENPNRARDHLANERTFLAWVRTGVAVVVFGFAIGRFAIALRQLTEFQGHPSKTTSISVWLGFTAMIAGVVMVVAGLSRYRKTRTQLDEGAFEPAGFVVDLVAILTVLFGLALAGYLIYTQQSLG
jgi:putative membrane protein